MLIAYGKNVLLFDLLYINLTSLFSPVAKKTEILISIYLLCNVSISYPYKECQGYEGLFYVLNLLHFLII